MPTSTRAEQKSKATISGHQGPWVPFGQANVYDKVWSGKKVPADAWRVLFWLTNRMTGTVKYEDDPNIYGVVAGGHSVSFKDIASDLQCSWSSVQRASMWLEDRGMITRHRSGNGQQYVYNVVNSIRQFELKTIPASETDTQEDDELEDYEVEAFNLEEDDVITDEPAPQQPVAVKPQLSVVTPPVVSKAAPVPTPAIMVTCPMPHCTTEGPEASMEKHKATRNYVCVECQKAYHTDIERDECAERNREEYTAWKNAEKVKEDAKWAALPEPQRRAKWEKDKAMGTQAGWKKCGRWTAGEAYVYATQEVCQ
jgi:hypothetical protein